jgi:hypothetical protein
MEEVVDIIMEDIGVVEGITMVDIVGDVLNSKENFASFNEIIISSSHFSKKDLTFAVPKTHGGSSSVG